MEYILMDLERTIRTGRATYWRQNSMGYTTDVYQAGLYNVDDAIAKVMNDVEDKTVYINAHKVGTILRRG